jgi:hypothetical protein
MNEMGYLENLYTKGCIRVHSGIYVNVTDFKKEHVLLDDIGHALAMLPRWGGHCAFPYSVAEHCIIGSYDDSLTTNEERLAFLMHDSSEAYMLDIPTPIKELFPLYYELEHSIMNVISQVLLFEYPLSEKTKVVDKNMLYSEWDTIIINKYRICEQMEHMQIKKMFIDRYNELKNH